MTGLPLNIDWQQILLHLFNFTILFGALYILLYKPVRDFMENREAHYAEMDSKAEQALADAENSKASYEKKERDFDEEIRAEKNRLSKEIETERERRLAAGRGCQRVGGKSGERPHLGVGLRPRTGFPSWPIL